MVGGSEAGDAGEGVLGGRGAAGRGREPGARLAPWDSSAARAGIGAARLDVADGKQRGLTERGEQHGDVQKPGGQ